MYFVAFINAFFFNLIGSKAVEYLSENYTEELEGRKQEREMYKTAR